jgi:sugar-specific transcriptional regulator TrmB
LEYNQLINGNEERQLLESTLIKLGLTAKEATIYIFLLKKAAHSASSIAKIIKLNKIIVYRILKHLRDTGFIISNMSYPASFSAVPLNVVLDNIAKVKRREADFLIKEKKILCDALKSFDIEDTSVIDDEIAILRNRQFAVTKGVQLTKKCRIETLIMTNKLSKLDYDIVKGPKKELIPLVKRYKAQFRILTRIDHSDLTTAKEMVARIEPYKEYIKVKHSEIALDQFLQFVICDDKGIILQFDITRGLDPKNVVEKYMWTNNKTIIRSYKMLYDKLWAESIDLRDMITKLK